jgi:hypothetical protein
MATETISQLPLVTGLAGNELFIISVPSTAPVPWTTARCTTDQILAFTLGIGAFVTMRQLLAALVSQGVFASVFQQLPSSLSNQYNIAWWHGSIMTPLDPFVTGFLQPTLGYTSGQIATLFALALTFPP